eukprot:14175868-Heterocapsa_arctica.AAC.1
MVTNLEIAGAVERHLAAIPGQESCRQDRSVDAHDAEVDRQLQSLPGLEVNAAHAVENQLLANRGRHVRRLGDLPK